MSSLRREDLDGYRAFMAAPPASWCGPRNARRATEAWRPFEGPLSARSQAYAMVVIKNLFTYLCDMQYLAGNPLRAARKKPDAPYPKTGDLPKFLALDTLERLLAALEQECTRLDGLGDEHAEMERMLFVARFLANTGLRRAELANAQLRHLFRNREIVRGIDRWFLTVTGKGNKTARVPINDTAHGALRRYLAVLGLDPLRADPNTPLVLRAGASGRHAADSEPMTDQTIYEIVKQALAVGAAILQADYPSDARILREATPHWFRHTFATLMSQKGHPLPVIRLCLRHASIATTAIYTHAEDEETYDAVSTLKL
jgi:integrase